MKILMTLCLLASLGIAHAAEPAPPAPLQGTRAIVLSNAGGERHQIGTISFSAADSGKTAFKIDLAKNMEDFFLDMRPFLCLTGPTQRLCLFPVQNEPALISADDMVPLEYALMFMRTKSKALHVNPFHGLYYKMQWNENGISGKVFEVDMAPFIAPDIVPIERRKRPLQPQDFFEADLNSNWLPQISIE